MNNCRLNLIFGVFQTRHIVIIRNLNMPTGDILPRFSSIKIGVVALGKRNFRRMTNGIDE
jgi:hypothetical protein